MVDRLEGPRVVLLELDSAARKISDVFVDVCRPEAHLSVVGAVAASPVCAAPCQSPTRTAAWPRVAWRAGG